MAYFGSRVAELGQHPGLDQSVSPTEESQGPTLSTTGTPTVSNKYRKGGVVGFATVFVLKAD